MLQVYSRTCAPCQYRVQLLHLRHYAHTLGTDVKIIETIGRPDIEQRSKELTDVPLPFVYNTETRGSMALSMVNKDISI